MAVGARCGYPLMAAQKVPRQRSVDHFLTAQTQIVGGVDVVDAPADAELPELVQWWWPTDGRHGHVERRGHVTQPAGHQDVRGPTVGLAHPGSVRLIPPVTLEGQVAEPLDIAVGPELGPDWSEVAAVMLDGVDVVVVVPPPGRSVGLARRLAARARQRGTVLIAAASGWPMAELTHRG
jgi:hypothetical protein